MHSHQSKFTVGQVVDVIHGGVEPLLRVMINSVTFFTPHEGSGILGTNAPNRDEAGVKYTVAKPLTPYCFETVEVWGWMMKLSS